jgi:hypothetical protein
MMLFSTDIVIVGVLDEADDDEGNGIEGGKN